MEQAQDTERRITDLEIKAAFSEDLLDQLNEIIVRQQQQIDQLIREIAHLRQYGTDGGVGTPHSLHDELPPHY